MAVTKFKQRKTPGVYVTEIDAFPASVIGVVTAVPAFIGYTEKATANGKSVLMKPIKIASMADYEAIFGRGFQPKHTITEAEGAEFDFELASGESVQRYSLTPNAPDRFYLYYSMRLFFDNGGGDCYIVSVGGYTDAASQQGVQVGADQLLKGLNAVSNEVGPTMLVIPDAVAIPSAGTLPGTAIPYSDDFAKLIQGMLKQASESMDRVAILDVYGTQALAQMNPPGECDLEALIGRFRADVGDIGLSFGMAYFPSLHTSVVGADDINFANIANLEVLQTLLGTQANQLYSGNAKQLATVKAYIDQMTSVDSKDPAAVQALNQNLANALPVMKQIGQVIAKQIGILPPSGAVAGLYALNDNTRGVWNAPANFSLTSVIAPTVKLTDNEQGDLNVPPDGKAVNAIRDFPGRGTVVWGARTLDGNSNDWRYIQVRRTIIYIEQSIKNALDPYVFAANDGNTWVQVVSSISNFLQGVWTQGGLMGATPSEAFTVECGLGSTMTAQDILEGYMIVQVVLQMIRPAEFIELTFRQRMEG